MKTIIYGNTGYGKSYTLIAPILRLNPSAILITANGISGELQCMGLEKDFLHKDSYIDLGNTPLSEKEEILMTEVVQKLEERGVADDSDKVIILTGFYKAINNYDFIKRITDWAASIVIEYTCMKCDIERGELKHILDQDSWNKVPVFEKLYNRVFNQNGYSYIEGTKYAWEDPFAKCEGILRYGEWQQEGSADEYPRIPCLGWYVEVTSVSPLDGLDYTQEEVESNYPDYYREQSVLKLQENQTFRKVN